MTMTTMPESLNSPVSGKAVFMEFGPPSQQMSPSPMSHGHYSMHCLHSAGHSQPDSSYSTASSFSRPLGYPYVNSRYKQCMQLRVIKPKLQPVKIANFLREGAWAAIIARSLCEDLVPEQALQIQEADEAGRGGLGEQRPGQRQGSVGQLAPGAPGVEHQLVLG
ncbi:homeobox protein DLX-1 [Alligator sinensis]|uniref:Homeobox protein DLX-1 n=1 Tax=Alligator sinensis TaxID=38654 RepID=A0A3Q0GA50_ALLSI|nr:homeobox protein DLX-1 [Alligator sinensis]